MKLAEAMKRDIQLSLKTIRFEFPRYLCFFVVLFLLQGLFCSILTLYSNNDRTQLAYLEGEYRTQSGSLYHLKLLGCNETQRAILHNLDLDQDEEKKIFTLLGADVTQTTDGRERRYDLYIQFEDEVEESYRKFRTLYRTAMEAEGPYNEAKTLLLSYQLERAGNRAVLVLQLVMVVVLGALAVWVLHTIMTNHYKFTYGVYMSFGANFLRLFRTAIWEMVWAALFTWLPAVVLSNLFCWLIFRKAELGFAVSIGGCLLTLFISLFTVGISVFASIKAVSRKPPVKHLIADDNSNLIHSPRRSQPLVGTTFPGGLGWLSFGRFWKYSVRLLAMTLSFAMLFVGGMTLAGCYQRMLDTPMPLYRVDFAIPGTPGPYQPSDKEETPKTEEGTEDGEGDSEDADGAEKPDSDNKLDAEQKEEIPNIDYSTYGYTDEISKVFAELPNLGTVYKESVFPARGVRSHVRFADENAKFGAGGVSVTNAGTKWRYQMNTDYKSLDKEIISSFEFLGYGIEGSLESVLTEKNTIAVTDSFLGSVRFDWKVGDTIYIARPVGDLEPLLTVEQEMLFVTDLDQILLAYLKRGTFKYTEYKIGAIISDMPTEENWSIFFNAKDYQKVTGYAPIYDSLQVYAKHGSTEQEEAKLYEYLRRAEYLYSNMTVTDLNTREARQLDANKNYTGVFTLFSSVLLAVSPMVWVFSQILFYYKRRQEFELYLAVGAPLDSIRQLFLQDALRYAGAGALVFAALAPVVSWFIHRIIGWGTRFIGGEMLASFRLPWIAYLIGILICAVCGFVSTMLPYFTYQKQGSPLHRDGGEMQSKEDAVHE
jgi:hypothetical protein